MSGYTIPYVVETTPRGERVADVYSRLLGDRIVFIGTPIDDGVANVTIAQLLHLAAAAPEHDISLYLNSPGGSFTAAMAIYDTMQFVAPDVATICVGQVASNAAILLAAGAPGKRAMLPHSRVLLHQPHTRGTQGSLSDLALEAAELGRVREEADEVLARHTGRTPAEVRSGAQSRYGPASPLRHVMDLLDQGLRFAVLAKPCDVAAIRNLGRIDDRVATQVPYLITIFCGGLPTEQTARKVAGYHGVAAEEVSVFRWRGNGWPGPTHVETHDGRTFDLTYDDVWYDERKPWKYDIQFRCKVCPDAIGELADVSCPDSWVMVDGMPIHEEAGGANLFIARTKAGDTTNVEPTPKNVSFVSALVGARIRLRPLTRRSLMSPSGLTRAASTSR